MKKQEIWTLIIGLVLAFGVATTYGISQYNNATGCCDHCTHSAECDGSHRCHK